MSLKKQNERFHIHSTYEYRFCYAFILDLSGTITTNKKENNNKGLELVWNWDNTFIINTFNSYNPPGEVFETQDSKS